MQAEPQIVREGWLIKYTPHNTWRRLFDPKLKKRYFVLRSGDIPGDACLVWYKDEQHRRSNRKPNGIIHLQDCEQVDTNLSMDYVSRSKKRYSYMWIFDIIITASKGKPAKYYFIAASQEEMNDWVRLLCHVCHCERDDNSDSSTGNETFTQFSSSHQPNPNHAAMNPDGSTGDRYTQEPHHDSTTPAKRQPQVPPGGSQFFQNGNTKANSSPPAAAQQHGPHVLKSPLNVVPPAPFLSRPPPPPPDSSAETSVPPQALDDQGLNPQPPEKMQGYIPLNTCISGDATPVEAVADTQVRGRLGASSDLEAPSIDFVNADQPPNYPPPPLPKDDSVFQQPQTVAAAHCHSRSPSKDSSVSSIHLSSTESEQGENNRVNGGKQGSVTSTTVDQALSASALNAGSGVPSGPTSPVSPAAPLYSRLPGSSGGSSASCFTDDTTTPPPRPPKTFRSSTTSQHQSSPYQNQIFPIMDGVEMSKNSRYDHLTFGPREVAFGSLPKTLPRTFGASGRQSQDSVSSKVSISPASSGWPRHLSSEKEEHFFGREDNSSMAAESRQGATGSRSRNISFPPVLDDIPSYSNFSPDPATLRPPATEVQLDCSTNNVGLESVADQYQNFVHPPAAVGDRPSITRGAPVLPERPPAVKRELKPARNVAQNSAGIDALGNGALPKVPKRQNEPGKSSVSGNNGNGPNSEELSEEQMPQINIHHQVSFKRRNLGPRQQTAPAFTGGFGKPKPLSDILDTEVKVEGEPQLDYVAVDAPVRTQFQMSPPDTPSSVHGRSVTSSFVSTTSFLTVTGDVANLSLGISPPPSTGYVQIDPKATVALRTLRVETAARRDVQQRTLERTRNQQQVPQQQVSTGTIGKKK